MDYNQLITSVGLPFAAAFAGSAFSKAEGPGQALDDIMTLIGFDRLHEVAEKKRASRERNIIEYKESIAQKVSKISEDNIQEPPLSIVGPALEASKYYIEEKDLREMFARLIANAMDESRNETVHPSFVEIIKQLNLNDAKILEHIKDVGYRTKHAYPIVQVIRKGPNGKGLDIIHPIVFIYDHSSDFLINSPSINNLERLGIVRTSFDEWFVDERAYSMYNIHLNFTEIINLNDDLEVKHGIMRLTDFGHNFIQTCVLQQ